MRRTSNPLVHTRPRVFSIYKYVLMLLVLLSQNKPVSLCDHGNLYDEYKGQSKNLLYIGGFLGFPDTDVDATIPTTLQTAVDHVNNLSGILDDYELRLRCGPRLEVDPASALCLLHDVIYTLPNILMAWGPLFSKEAEIVNEVAPMYNLIQVTGANSPILKDRKRFPLTIQMSLDEDLLNPARAAFVKHMDWKRVAIVFEDIEYFRQNMESLATTLENHNVTVLTIEVVNNADEPTGAIHNLKRHDARIIFAGFYEDSAVKFFCQVYRESFYASKYVWILPGWFQKYWWKDDVTDVNCDIMKLQDVLSGHISISWINAVDNATKISFGGVKPHEHQMTFINSILNDDSELKVRQHSEVYDSVIMMALTLNQSLPTLSAKQLHGSTRQTYVTNETAQLFWKNAINVDFIGLSGHMKINDEGFRSQDGLLIYVYQHQGVERVKILEYINNTANFDAYKNRSFKWRGPYKPVDGVTRQHQYVVVSSKLRIPLYTMNTLGLVLALLFLFINIRYRNRKAIKVTSPHLNNLIIGGCVCLYTVGFFIAVDTSQFEEQLFVAKCSVLMWLICVGISLSMGSLFMKTYRIRAIFVDAVTKLRKIKMSDSRLIMGVLILVLLDTVIIWAWIIVGRPEVRSMTLQSYNSSVVDEREVLVAPIIRYCSCYLQKYFEATLYVVKSLLLIAGVFLAWETRRISIAELNDSKNIALSVYVIALTIALVVPISNWNGTSLELKVAVIGFCIIAGNTVILCLTFLPKIFLLCTTEESEIHISLMPKSGRGIHQSPQDTISKLQFTLAQKEQLLNKLREKNNIELCMQLSELNQNI